MGFTLIGIHARTGEYIHGISRKATWQVCTNLTMVPRRFVRDMRFDPIVELRNAPQCGQVGQRHAHQGRVVIELLEEPIAIMVRTKNHQMARVWVQDVVDQMPIELVETRAVLGVLGRKCLGQHIVERKIHQGGDVRLVAVGVLLAALPLRHDDRIAMPLLAHNR